MKKLLIVMSVALLISMTSFADDVRIEVVGDSIGALEIQGDVAETIYNLTKFGKARFTSGKPRVERNDTVVGGDITCFKEGRHYSCTALVSRGGDLDPIRKKYALPKTRKTIRR